MASSDDSFGSYLWNGARAGYRNIRNEIIDRKHRGAMRRWLSAEKKRVLHPAQNAERLEKYRNKVLIQKQAHQFANTFDQDKYRSLINHIDHQLNKFEHKEGIKNALAKLKDANTDIERVEQYKEHLINALEEDPELYRTLKSEFDELLEAFDNRVDEWTHEHAVTLPRATMPSPSEPEEKSYTYYTPKEKISQTEKIPRVQRKPAKYSTEPIDKTIKAPSYTYEPPPDHKHYKVVDSEDKPYGDTPYGPFNEEVSQYGEHLKRRREEISAQMADAERVRKLNSLTDRSRPSPSAPPINVDINVNSDNPSNSTPPSEHPIGFNSRPNRIERNLPSNFVNPYAQQPISLGNHYISTKLVKVKPRRAKRIPKQRTRDTALAKRVRF